MTDVGDEWNFWRVSSFKNWLGIGGTPWVNTYHFVSNLSIGVTGGVWDDLVQALVAFEKGIHVPQVYIDRVVVASYIPDGTPYDPDTFRVIPVSVYGERSVGLDEKIDLNAVLKVRRETTSGRSGKIAFRGVLTEGDVNATATGFWTLQAGSGVGPGGAAWVAAYAEIDPYIGGAGTDGIVMAVISTDADAPGVPVARGVVNLLPAGAGFNRMNHRWFNRPS